ncbi:peroxidase-related enzyme [Elstera cyanobacteriorum]|uniref:peroxidase-related enzyme n=1 Tax=Elstera cyanobacteriorum TaxID=2022747 RepID=UPI00308113C6
MSSDARPGQYSPQKVMDLHTPDEASLPDDLKPYFQKCRDKLGMVPNVLRAWLLRPEKLRTFIASYNELMLGASGLSKLEREMIAVAVSAVNRCYYCLVAHGAAVRQMSGDPELGEMLVMNYRVAELPARQRAMLDFAVKLTETPHLITANDRASLSAQGFSDEDVFDICEVTGFFNMTNRVAHGVDMMPNPEYHRQAR